MTATAANLSYAERLPMARQPLHARLGHDGIDGFDYPVAYSELTAASHALAEGWATVLRQEAGAPGGSSDLFLMQTGRLCTLALSLLHAALVVERKGADALNVLPPKAPIAEALLGRRPWSPDLQEARLTRGVAQPRGLERILFHGSRLRRRWRREDGLNWSVRLFPNMADRIVALNSDPLIAAYARTRAVTPVLVDIRQWVPAGVPDTEPSTDEDRRIADSLVDVVHDAYRRLGGNVDERLRTATDELKEAMLGAACLLRVWLARIMAEAHRLPAELWLVNAADPWSRVLCCAVRMNGGLVVGHDHGTGEGFASPVPGAILQLEFIDRFVTFSPQMANVMRAVYPAHVMVRDDAPEFAWAEPSQSAQMLSGQGRKLMYVATLFCGESVRPNVNMPDAVAFDWQARLLTKLRMSGHEVVQKQHPLSDAALTASLQTVTKVDLLAGRFEEHLDDIGVAIFDCPWTTAFRVALVSGLPVILIDFGMGEFCEEAREALEDSCTVVKGWFSPDHRAQVDWDELAEAIAGTLQHRSGRNEAIRALFGSL